MKGYRFFSNPNHSVTDGETGRFLFKFDYKGEYVTLDPILANRMKAHFRHEEIELVEVKEQEPVPEKEPEKVYECKKCDFKTENKGELLAHYREHKKEG
jgi:hypothetical protein